MNKFAIAVSVAALTITAASAADMAPRYTKAPVIVDPGYNWTGFYVGLNGGYSWGRGDAISLPASVFAAPVRSDVNGGLGGAQAGYNWQIDRKWVIGVEADIQGTDERGSSNRLLGPLRVTLPGGDFNLVTTGNVLDRWSMPWFATFRGRAGFLIDPSLLLYGTGGVAVGEVKKSSQLTLTAQVFGPGAFGTVPAGAAITATSPLLSESQTRVGWTAGAGLEKKFSQNWSAKAEYLYIDFGSKTYFGGTADQTSVSFHDHIFRVGINYAFNQAVVAKY